MQKRGGGAPHEALEEEHLPLSQAQAETLLELDDGLQRLAAAYPRKSQAVELRYLGYRPDSCNDAL